MAARLLTRSYNFSSTAAVSLATILNSANDTYISTLAIRTPLANAGTVYWRDALAGEDGGHLGPDEAVTFDLAGKFVRTADLWLRGAVDDDVEITAIG